MQSYSVFLFTIFFGVCSSLPLGGSDADITVIRQHQEMNEDNSFSWAFENSDGTKQEQSGYIKNPGTDTEGLFVQGAFSYPDKDSGSQIAVKYTADENGFNPEGKHLPTPPPIPPAIQKLLSIVYGNARKQIRAAQAQAFDRVEYF